MERVFREITMRSEFSHVMYDDIADTFFMYFKYGYVQGLGTGFPEMEVDEEFCVHIDPKSIPNLLTALAKEMRLMNNSTAATEQLGLCLDQIPYLGLEAVSRVFAEGQKKYGRDNWKKGVNDPFYQTERLNHAIRHLMLWANGDRSEEHLAKVAWFCLTQITLDDAEQPDDELAGKPYTA